MHLFDHATLCAFVLIVLPIHSVHCPTPPALYIYLYIIKGGSILAKITRNNKKIDYIIAVDGGLEKLDRIKIKPNHIIGDFDSISDEILKKYNEKIN